MTTSNILGQSSLNLAKITARNSICGAGAGYLAARIFTIANPVTGAVFGTALGASTALLNSFWNKLFDSFTTDKTAKLVLKLLANMGIAMLATSLAGFAITFKASLLLTGTMVGIAFLTFFVADMIFKE